MSASPADKLNRLQKRTAAKLARAASGNPRTHQRVHRRSRHRGERERTFWSPVDPLWSHAILEAARLEEVRTKKKGKRNGALGATALRILELMVDLVDWLDGTLEPSYHYIQRRTGLAVDTIWKALKRLAQEGYLEWIRRTQPVEDDGTGRTVEQIPNAYRLLVPDRWRDRIAMRIEQWRERAVRATQRWRSDAGDQADRQARAAADKVRKTRAWAEATIADPILRADVLASLEGEVAIPPDEKKPHPKRILRVAFGHAPACGLRTDRTPSTNRIDYHHRRDHRCRLAPARASGGSMRLLARQWGGLCPLWAPKPRLWAAGRDVRPPWPLVPSSRCRRP